MRDSLRLTLSVVSVIAIVLYAFFLLLSTRPVRALLAEMWYRATHLAERPSTPEALKLAYSIFVGFFENDEGVIRGRFLATAFVFNAGAIASGVHGISAAMLPGRDNDELANAWCGMVLLAPALLLAWMMWDFITFIFVRRVLGYATNRSTTWPVALAFVVVITLSYVLPAFAASVLGRRNDDFGGLVYIPFDGVDWVLFIYTMSTPFMPLSMSIASYDSCKSCSVAGLPAGLSVSIPLLTLIFVICLAMNRRTLNAIATVAAHVSDLNARRAADIAFIAFSIATGLLGVVTAR